VTIDPTPETARALLYRHGLPEDIIDGALCLHAQELAALQRLRMDELDLAGQKARIVGRIVDLIDPTKTAAAVPAPATDRADLRARLFALIASIPGSGTFDWCSPARALLDEYAAAVLPASLDRAAVRAAALHEAADAVRNGAFADTLRRMADETPQEHPLAAMLEGFARLLATSSRDWGQYAPDAWLYAVICGWDCEETTHDETCTHGAMEEIAERHGWDDDAVAKARRYRAMVHAITEPAVVAQPDEEA
jgi:hypothetical protein